MNKKEDSIESLTKDLTSLLLKAKSEINRLKTENKKAGDFKQATRTEYRKLYEENQKLRQKVKDYEQYFKSQNIQKKRNERAARAKENLEISKKRKRQMEELSILDEIKKLKKLDLEGLLGGSKRKAESESEKESGSESEKEKKVSKKKKKNKKIVLD